MYVAGKHASALFSPRLPETSPAGLYALGVVADDVVESVVGVDATGQASRQPPGIWALKRLRRS